MLIVPLSLISSNVRYTALSSFAAVVLPASLLSAVFPLSAALLSELLPHPASKPADRAAAVNKVAIRFTYLFPPQNDLISIPLPDMGVKNL